MNPFEFVIAIVAITTIGSIIRAKHAGRYGLRQRGGRGMRGLGARMGFGPYGTADEEDDYADDRETQRLREEVKLLKERIQTLERITVDKENSLARQIDDLRER